MDRRDFLKASAIASAGSMLSGGYSFGKRLQPGRVVIRTEAAGTLRTRLAGQELMSGLRMLHRAMEVARTDELKVPNATMLTLAIDAGRFSGPEEYEISGTGQDATLTASSEQALLYSVFDFLERQGLVFGTDGVTAPIDASVAWRLPQPGRPWKGSPQFAVRGLLPWPDFLNCISVYNDEDFRAYFANMLRMRSNMFAMHVYTQNEPGPLAESYLSFDFAGVGHRAALETTAMTSWGTLPQRTSTFKMGAAEFFDAETFGSDATRLAVDNWDRARRTTAMLQAAFGFAEELGIRTGIGFEPYQNPAEIVRALPPEALSHPGGFIESNTARDLLERRLADLLERYPNVDHVWLWQDENANWESRKKNVPLSTTPFVQAHEFLQRHAPEKRLVLAGWGGVTRHFESLHRRLPEDIVFSSLNDSTGWDPVSEVYGKLGSRERWPIPWLEDDPSMWFPQFRASRFETDMQRAEKFGCQGMLGIHWRQRIVDPTATYFARAAWNRELTAAAHYRDFCAAQAVGPRAVELANLFDACDRGHTISTTFLGSYDASGFAVRQELTGDYEEAFQYAANEPDPAVLPRQRETAERFRQLTAEAGSSLERDRIGYFSGFVNLMVPYCDAYGVAHRLDAVLKQAVALRAAGKPEAARATVVQQGVPLWLEMAPLIRRTMLEYQAVVATRSDQGQLASMQNKFVRIALERLRLSIKEFLGELPPEMTAAYNAAISPENANPPRVFLPTRPSLLKPGESLRLFIVAPGHQNVDPVKLLTRAYDGQWQSSAAVHAGNDVYAVRLGPFPPGTGSVEYYAAAARRSGKPLTPERVYSLNILE